MCGMPRRNKARGQKTRHRLTRLTAVANGPRVEVIAESADEVLFAVSVGAPETLVGGRGCRLQRALGLAESVQVQGAGQGIGTVDGVLDGRLEGRAPVLGGENSPETGL